MNEAIKEIVSLGWTVQTAHDMVSGITDNYRAIKGGVSTDWSDSPDSVLAHVKELAKLPKPTPIESIKALLEDHESMRRKYKESAAGPCAIQRDARMALLDLDNENRQLLESARYLASLRVQDCEKCGAQGKFRGVNCSECYNGQVVVSAVLPEEVEKARVLYSLFQRPAK